TALAYESSVRHNIWNSFRCRSCDDTSNPPFRNLVGNIYALLPNDKALPVLLLLLINFLDPKTFILHFVLVQYRIYPMIPTSLLPDRPLIIRRNSNPTPGFFHIIMALINISSILDYSL